MEERTHCIGQEDEEPADQFPVGMSVLAVDDDMACLKILETLLLRCRYRVTTTTQAATALMLLRDSPNRFDLVISDVHMPDMDGFKLLEQVGLEMDLPVIMLSENGERQTVMRGIKHGACDYLLKPVRMQELMNIWQHVVRRRRSDPRYHDNHNIDDCGDDQKMQPVNHEGTPHAAPVNHDRRMDKKRRRKKGDEEEDSDDRAARRRLRFVWAPELHCKFVNAVNQLGIDKAIPRKILDLMNVENVTREQVASHLQKFRMSLKKVDFERSQQLNLAAAFLWRNNSNSLMGSPENSKNYQVDGSYSKSSPLERMISTFTPGAHGMLLPSQPIQLVSASNHLGRPFRTLEKPQCTRIGGQGSLLRDTTLPSNLQQLQGSSKNFSTGFSGNFITNDSTVRIEDVFSPTSRINFDNHGHLSSSNSMPSTFIHPAGSELHNLVKSFGGNIVSNTTFGKDHASLNFSSEISSMPAFEGQKESSDLCGKEKNATAIGTSGAEDFRIDGMQIGLDHGFDELTNLVRSHITNRGDYDNQTMQPRYHQTPK